MTLPSVFRMGSGESPVSGIASAYGAESRDPTGAGRRGAAETARPGQRDPTGCPPWSYAMPVTSIASSCRKRQNPGLDAWIAYAPNGQVDIELHASLPLFWNQGHEHVQRVPARLLGYVA